MAVEFVATVGTTDYSFDWVTEEIIIEMGVTEVMAEDLKEAIHTAQDEVVGMWRSPIATFGNPVTLTGTSSTFLNVILQGGWKINSFAATGTLTVGDGNVVSLNDGIDIFGPNVFVNFVNNTSSAGVYVSGAASGLTPTQSAQLEELWQDKGFDAANPIEVNESTGVVTVAGIVRTWAGAVIKTFTRTP